MLALFSILAHALAAPTAAMDPRYAPLLSWLDSCGATIGPVRLGKSAVGAGAGAFATEALDENALLFSVPETACVTLYDACGDADVGESLARLTATGQGGATVALAGIIAKEWLCEGANGPRGPYLAMLPWNAAWPPEGEQEQEHVLWWSEAQVDRLDGSAAYEDAVGIRSQVTLATKVLKSLLGAAVRKAYQDRNEPVWNVWKADDDIEKAVRGAFVAILTRSFTQEGTLLEDQFATRVPLPEEKRLVPLLDMLQHASDPNVKHVASLDPRTGRQRIEVRTRRRIEENEELLNCYDFGEPLAPELFLTRFGFVPGETVGSFVASLAGKGRLPFGFKLESSY
jgi:hypothetical protein